MPKKIILIVALLAVCFGVGYLYRDYPDMHMQAKTLDGVQELAQSGIAKMRVSNFEVAGKIFENMRVSAQALGDQGQVLQAREMIADAQYFQGDEQAAKATYVQLEKEWTALLAKYPKDKRLHYLGGKRLLRLAKQLAELREFQMAIDAALLADQYLTPVKDWTSYRFYQGGHSSINKSFDQIIEAEGFYVLPSQILDNGLNEVVQILEAKNYPASQYLTLLERIAELFNFPNFEAKASAYDGYRMAEAYAKLGTEQLIAGKTEDAVKSYSLGVKAQKFAFDKDLSRPNRYRDLGVSYLQRGFALYHFDKADAAREDYEKAIKLLLADAPNRKLDEHYFQHLGKVYAYYSALEKQQGNFDLALEYEEKSAAVHQKILNFNHLNSDPYWYKLLFDNYVQFGHIYKLKGHSDVAVEFYKRAIELGENQAMGYGNVAEIIESLKETVGDLNK